MPVTTADRPTLGTPQRPFRRSRENAVLGGVAGGIAIRFGVSERTIRILFALGALAGGVGLLAYVTTWITVRRSGEDQSIIERLTRHEKQRHTIFVIFIAIVVTLMLFHSIGLHQLGSFAWTVALSVIGLFAVWRGTSADERAGIDATISAAPILAHTPTSRRALAARVLAGAVLIIIGLVVLSRVGGIWGAAVPSLLGAITLLGGLLILLAPWWLETVRDLSHERRERVRAEERATMVAHLHDSVLQTLTLIERSAGDEQAVRRFARGQERELRKWLFDPNHAGEASNQVETVSTVAKRIEAEVEDDYGVRVELVIVGDCAVDEHLLAMLAAGKEAAVNAAKWSGAPIVSIYIEVEPELITMFIRDTGTGFDTTQVASDRHGIAWSIRGRMDQHGGRTVVKSELGSGTEIELAIPRRKL